jgi:hypothetical protein
MNPHSYPVLQGVASHLWGLHFQSSISLVHGFSVCSLGLLDARSTWRPVVIAVEVQRYFLPCLLAERKALVSPTTRNLRIGRDLTTAALGDSSSSSSSTSITSIALGASLSGV